MQQEKKNRYDRIAPALGFVLIALTVLALILGFIQSRSRNANEEQAKTNTPVYMTETEGEERTITVIGSSVIEVPADEVTFLISVTGEGDSVQEAGEKTIASYNELMGQLMILGFDEDGLQTSAISLDKETTYLKDGVVETKHVGRFSIWATLPASTNNSRLVNIFDTISKVDGTEIGSMSFSASDTDAVELDAYEAAFDDAKLKAQRLLESTGEKGELKVKSIQPTGIGMERSTRALSTSGYGAYLPSASESVIATVDVEFEF